MTAGLAISHPVRRRRTRHPRPWPASSAALQAPPQPSSSMGRAKARRQSAREQVTGSAGDGQRGRVVRIAAAPPGAPGSTTRGGAGWRTAVAVVLEDLGSTPAACPARWWCAAWPASPVVPAWRWSAGQLGKPAGSAPGSARFGDRLKMGKVGDDAAGQRHVARRRSRSRRNMAKPGGQLRGPARSAVRRRQPTGSGGSEGGGGRSPICRLRGSASRARGMSRPPGVTASMRSRSPLDSVGLPGPDRVVVTGGDDQVTSTRPGSVGDADRGTTGDDAQLDEVVADPAGQLSAQRVVRGDISRSGRLRSA